MITIARYANGTVQIRDKRTNRPQSYTFNTEALFQEWYDRNVKSNSDSDLQLNNRRRNKSNSD